MEERILPKLLVSRKEAYRKIQERIKMGQQLHDQEISSEDDLSRIGKKSNNWSEYNCDLLTTLFANFSLSDEYESFYYPRFPSDRHRWEHADGLGEYHILEFDWKVGEYRDDMVDSIKSLEGIRDRLELFDELADVTPRPSDPIGINIFIGHGRSQDWRELKDFISERLKLPYDEFNRVSVAGLTIVARLTEMLNQACMAFLVMTAEDEHTDNTLHARENVIQEIGLFQVGLVLKEQLSCLKMAVKNLVTFMDLFRFGFRRGT